MPAQTTRVAQITFVVTVVALSGVVGLAWWSGQEITSQIVRDAENDQLRVLHQAKSGFERYLNELSYKARALAGTPAVIQGDLKDDEKLQQLHSLLTEFELLDIQVLRVDPFGKEIPSFRLPNSRPIQIAAHEMDWAKDPNRKGETRIDVVEVSASGEGRDLADSIDGPEVAYIRCCVPVWSRGESEFAGVLCLMAERDEGVLGKFLDPISTHRSSYTFAIESGLGEESDVQTKLIHNASEPAWVRDQREGARFLEALQRETHIFEPGDDAEVARIPRWDGGSRREVIAYAKVLRGSYRWIIGLSTPYDVVIEPYGQQRYSNILMVFLTLGVLSILLALLYYQRAEATEQRKLQLMAVQHDYRELFAENPTATLIFNQNEQLADCNYSAERLISLSRQEAMGKRLMDLFSNQGVQALWEQLKEQGNLHANDVELTRREDEVTIVVEVWGRRIGDNWILLAHDIERRRDLERQISRLRRMDSMGSLASALAHDFNNILGQVQILVSNLLTELESDSTLREDLSAIEEKVDDASQLIANLLSFREEVLSSEIVWLEPVLREFVSNERKTLDDNIHLELQFVGEIPGVWIRPYALRRVLDNLCRNASDAMPYGGTLRIRVSTEQVRPGQANGQLKEGRYANIEVSDTGQGMSQDVLDTIFEPFFTTKRTGGGTGLGLWTVYKIIRRTGGAVLVRSRLGKGTQFSLYLPDYRPDKDLE